ncbi:MAG TPA: class I SAM-dependent methyltransferase, partial [Candidatus Dormibacteraeota bacterium]|nr:class I SAM-dependent methyltransferase [Candidatus Dormibacteraeota bacterium]
MPDAWSGADAYEGYIGRWSRPVAVAFLDWLALPGGLRWLDVGCGTGALTAAVLDRCRPEQVTGVDPSPAYIEWAASQVVDGRADFQLGDATTLPGGAVDVVVSGLSINFVPDVPAALDAMRNAAPAGTVAAYVWDYADRMEMLRQFWDAVVTLDPASRNLDERVRFPICNPERLEAAWQTAGFANVRTSAIEVPAHFDDFDDLWQPFLAGQGPAPGYVSSLDVSARERLRERLRAQLPVEPDGAINLS